MYSRSLSLVAKKALRLSLSLSFSKRARAPSPKKESKQHNFAGVFGVPLFFFRKKKTLSGPKKTDRVLKAKRKRDLKCIKSTREFFFCLSRERELVHTTPFQKKKTSKTLNT